MKPSTSQTSLNFLLLLSIFTLLTPEQHRRHNRKVAWRSEQKHPDHCRRCRHDDTITALPAKPSISPDLWPERLWSCGWGQAACQNSRVDARQRGGLCANRLWMWEELLPLMSSHVRQTGVPTSLCGEQLGENTLHLWVVWLMEARASSPVYRFALNWGINDLPEQTDEKWILRNTQHVKNIQSSEY